LFVQEGNARSGIPNEMLSAYSMMREMRYGSLDEPRYLSDSKETTTKISDLTLCNHCIIYDLGDLYAEVVGMSYDQLLIATFWN
jgi:hypothetical protein